MHKLSRREVLRGAGVAALSVGAAVVPFAAHFEWSFVSVDQVQQP